jgi:hypothetical protein
MNKVRVDVLQYQKVNVDFISYFGNHMLRILCGLNVLFDGVNCFIVDAVYVKVLRAQIYCRAPQKSFVEKGKVSIVLAWIYAQPMVRDVQPQIV